MTDKHDKQNYRLGKAGLSFFSSLMHSWSVSEEDQAIILGLSKEELSQLKDHLADGNFSEFSSDLLLRLGLMVGISRNLNTLYPTERHASCLKAENARFGGLSLLDKLLTGKLDEMREVKTYLDSCCGSHFL